MKFKLTLIITAFGLSVIYLAVLTDCLHKLLPFISHTIIIWMGLMIGGLVWSYFYCIFDKDNYVTLYKKPERLNSKRN